MCSIRRPKPIRVGLLAEEPLRLAGLTCIFEQAPTEGQAPLIPVIGTLQGFLTGESPDYLVVDLNSCSGGLDTLESIRRVRPEIRLIVIGPEGNDEMVLQSIMAGARAYLDLSASPQTVRQAIDVVTSGSIWAPRRLMSKLIDRLLSSSDASLSNSSPHLTDREREVLELILLARPNREIARQLGIEERTVKAHVSRLMRKAGVENRIELSMRVLNGMIIPSTGFIERRRGDRRNSSRPPQFPPSA
jgi:DNA-binding NarL/FixJ family response regulator